MNQDITEKLDSLSRKIEASLREKNALKEEIRYYQAENRELKAAVGKKRLETKNFPVPTESLNIANENERYAERIAAIVKQIDEYVEEIDKCVAQLG
jgi:hypothetical protein